MCKDQIYIVYIYKYIFKYNEKDYLSIQMYIQLYLGHMLNLWSDVILQLQPNDLQAFPSNHINGSLNTCGPTDAICLLQTLNNFWKIILDLSPPPQIIWWREGTFNNHHGYFESYSLSNDLGTFKKSRFVATCDVPPCGICYRVGALSISKYIYLHIVPTEHSKKNNLSPSKSPLRYIYIYI